MKARRRRRVVVNHWGRGEVGRGRRTGGTMVGLMGGDGNENNGKQCQTICLAPPRARGQRVRQGMAVATAHRRGGRPGFLGPSRGGGQPAAAATGTTVPWCRRPPGAAPSPPPCCPDRPRVTMVIAVPTLRPAAAPAMATPSGTTMPPLPQLPAKRTTRDRRTTTAAATTGTTTRTMTSGGGARSSTHPPPRHPWSLATSSAIPLPRPACCCWASRCPGSTSNTATP
jgi:hypothetical protein